jgi:hypothetical protein
MTPLGCRPASDARSTAASVCPARWSTPPGRASSGKMWPGLHEGLRLGLRVGEDRDGLRAVVGGDAGGDPFGGVDGDREGGALRFAVLREQYVFVQLRIAEVPLSSTCFKYGSG